MTGNTLEQQRARELLAAEYERSGLRGSYYITNPDMVPLTGVEPDEPPISVVLAAIEAALRLSAGADWVLVPREPTEAMVEAICDAHGSGVWPDGYGQLAKSHRRADARDGYRAMLAAAPRHEPGEGV